MGEFVVYEMRNPMTGEFLLGATANLEGAIRHHYKFIRKRRHSDRVLKSFSYREPPIFNVIESFSSLSAARNHLRKLIRSHVGSSLILNDRPEPAVEQPKFQKPASESWI